MERLSRDTPHAKRLAVAKAWLTAAMIGVIACAALASAVQNESLVLKGSHIIGEWSHHPRCCCPHPGFNCQIWELAPAGADGIRVL